MAVAAPARVPTRLSPWDEEIERLVEIGPSLPRSARIAVRRVLTSLLDDPATDPGTAHDVRRLLDVLEQALYSHRLT